MSVVTLGFKALIKMFKPSITKLNLALTWKCNHRCASCNIWRDAMSGDELRLVEIIQILVKNEPLWIAITGGEPFLRNDIHEILRAMLLRTPAVSITTNGSMTDVIAFSVDYALMNTKGLLAVNVSLEGDEGVHDEFTGVNGSFNKVMETITELQTIKNPRLRINIEYLLSSSTVKGLSFVRGYARKNNLSLTYVLEARSNFYHNTNVPLGKFSIPSVNFDIKNPFNYIYVKSIGKDGNPKCVEGQYTCAITPDGQVKPCWFVDCVAYNIRDTEYNILPLGDECAKVVEQCNVNGGCWTPCTAYNTMIFRPWRLL